jgi:hypothetical protein
MRRYNGAANLGDQPVAIAVRPNGKSVFITGSSMRLIYNPAGPPWEQGLPDYLTVSYDASSGAKLWRKRFKGQSNGGEAISLTVSNDGRSVYVLGRTYYSGSSSDYVTIRYGAGAGALKWRARYNKQGNGADAPAALVVSPDSTRVYVTGTSSVSANWDYATVAYVAK